MIYQHRLRTADFDELARGRGDPDVIALLERGQLSKRLLQVWAVLDAVAGDRSAAAATARAAWDRLCELDRSSPGAVFAVLLHPHVGAWLARCLGHLCGPSGASAERAVGRLAAVAASVAVRAGRDLEVELGVYDQAVMLPTLGRCRVPWPDGPAVLRVSGGTAELRSAAGTARFRPGPAPEPGWEPLRLLRTDTAGRRLAVQLDDLDPYRDLPGLPAADRLAPADADRWREVLGRAWSLLVRHHTGAAEALAAGLRTIVPLRDTGAEQGVSATSVDAFGAAAMSLPASGETLAVGLIHEFQHSKLGALLDLVPLYDRSRAVLLYAPWRDDPRPLGGLLQGAYAYLGVTAFWRVQRHVRAGRAAQFAHFEFARWREQSSRAVDVIAASGALTAEGERFVRGMGEALDGWRRDPVPRAAAAAAWAANLDHWLSWRARNLVPDRPAVSAAAAAWRTGQPCPAPGRPAAPAPGGFTPGLNGRLTLLHTRLRDPDRFRRLRADPAALAAELPHASPADLYLTGDDRTAAAAGYQQELAADPGSTHAWAGLALAGGHGADLPLELVRAVHGELSRDGEPPDPAAVLAWAGA